MAEFFRRSFRPAPIKEGDTADVKIEAVGEKGDGIARVNGFVVFVPGVKVGDEVKIRVTRVLKKFAFGELAGEAKPEAEGETAEIKEEEAAPKKQEKTPKTEVYGEEEEIEEVDYADSEEF